MNIVEAARSYIGVPWRHRGRSRRGVDCAGLLIVAVKDAEGIDIESPDRYGREPFNNGLETYCFKAANLVWSGEKGQCSYDYLAVGDGVLMAPDFRPRHLGIIGDDPIHRFSLIHSDSTVGVRRVIEHGLNDGYLKMIVSVFRRPA